MRTAILTLFITMFTASFAFGQMAQGEGVFSLNAGLAFPQGDFADDTGQDAGGAKMGFGGFAEYDYVIDPSGWLWTSLAGFYIHSIDEDVISTNQDVNVDAGSWKNIPIMTGVKFQRAASPTVSIFGAGLLGLNYFLPPGAELSQQQGQTLVEAELEAEGGFSFGFSIGGGVVINDKIVVSARILNLGNVEYEGTLTQEGFQDQEIEGETSIAMFTLSAGIRL
ncbi:MAG: outer membrane beta-barrel protein [Calditrichota bacterium]